MSGEDRQKVPHPLLSGEWVGERKIGSNRVLVAPAVALAREVPGVHELADDAMGGAFGDTYCLSDLTQANPRILRDADQDASVVREE